MFFFTGGVASGSACWLAGWLDPSSLQVQTDCVRIATKGRGDDIVSNSKLLSSVDELDTFLEREKGIWSEIWLSPYSEVSA